MTHIFYSMKIELRWPQSSCLWWINYKMNQPFLKYSFSARTIHNMLNTVPSRPGHGDHRNGGSVVWPLATWPQPHPHHRSVPGRRPAQPQHINTEHWWLVKFHSARRRPLLGSSSCSKRLLALWIYVLRHYARRLGSLHLSTNFISYLPYLNTRLT